MKDRSQFFLLTRRIFVILRCQRDSWQRRSSPQSGAGGSGAISGTRRSGAISGARESNAISSTISCALVHRPHGVRSCFGITVCRCARCSTARHRPGTVDYVLKRPQSGRSIGTEKRMLTPTSVTRRRLGWGLKKKN